tara:strand:- start:7603 stop:10335 length:2733 start_codon:yes stop_codon:yes gene_type:complete
MSRLIFEGNTTKRFGEKFPRPLIEQVRITNPDDEVIFEVDIAFYFKVPNEQEKVDAFIENLSNEDNFSQSIVLSSFGKSLLGRLKASKNFEALFASSGTSSFRSFYSTTKVISFSNFIDLPSTEIKDDFYNLGGTRFIKIYGTLQILKGIPEEKYVGCFVKNGLDETYFENQTSDLIFEKVLDLDGSITTDPIVAFLEQNQNFYYQTPLMSLVRTYHKTDDYGHTDLIKQFSDVLQNYFTDESNDLSATLSVEGDNPRLLIILKNKIDAFTDKSPVTIMGKLYSQMASNIVLADTFISRQEQLSKRQFVNTKIIEQRYISLPSLEKNESIGGFYLIANDSAFLPEPLVSRNLFPFYDPGTGGKSIIDLRNPPNNISKYFKLQTNAYYFFDYEKALNYKSEISRFINPYNIQQIFGKGSLANYFNFTSCGLVKAPLGTYGNVSVSQAKTYALVYVYPEEDDFAPKFGLVQEDKDPDVNYHRLIGSQGRIENAITAGGAFQKIVFSGLDQETLYSTLIQRGFDTNNGLGDYRLSLFELNDYQAASLAGDYFSDFLLNDINIECTITIRDKTMEFYDVFIRQKIFSLLEGITRYLDFANDFCSYNNIDDRFNDFFVESIRNEFTEPYPWSEAPFYYYSFLQMMLASWNDFGGSDSARRREGVLLDLDSIREAALDKRKVISPETGFLSELQDFRRDLEKLVNIYFTKGRGLDESNEIYRIDALPDESYYLVKPSELIKFSRSDNFDKENISSELNVEQLEELQAESELQLTKCASLFIEIRERQAAGDAISLYAETIDEYDQRGCDALGFSFVARCRDLKEEWIALKAEYDRAKAILDATLSLYGRVLNGREQDHIDQLKAAVSIAKVRLEDKLTEYRLGGYSGDVYNCVELIGPVNDGDTLEQDMQDAGLLE